jgi:hypothetical protein
MIFEPKEGQPKWPRRGQFPAVESAGCGQFPAVESVSRTIRIVRVSVGLEQNQPAVRPPISGKFMKKFSTFF